MNTPTAVVLIVTALWPVWVMFGGGVDDRLHRGTFTYQVTDEDGHILEEGTADLERVALERGEAAANKWRIQT